MTLSFSMITYILVLALFVAPKPIDPVAKELAVVNKVLKEYENVDCTDKKFTSAAINLGKELKVFSKILEKATKKEIKDNKADIAKFVEEYEVAQQDKISCVELSQQPYFTHSII